MILFYVMQCDVCMILCDAVIMQMFMGGCIYFLVSFYVLFMMMSGYKCYDIQMIENA